MLGTFNVEPTKIPCLQKGNLAGLWVDLHGSWARTAGVDAAITCKRDWACLGGTWRDFVIGCPLASAALEGCWVDGCRWIQPYFSVCASFPATRWSAKDVQPVTVSPLWPASWVSAVDKSRTFKSAEVRDFWEIYDKTLEFIPVGDALALGDSLAGRDVHLAWAVCTSPLPPSLPPPPPLPPLLTLKKGLRAVASLVRSIANNCFSLARALELLVGVSDWDFLVGGSAFGLDVFGARIDVSINMITEFVKQLAFHRRDFAIRGWRSWVLEDPLVHSYRWLRPDLVPPAPFLSCDPKDSVDDSGVLVEPHAIDEHVRKAWMPFFCRGARESAELDAFRAVAEGLTLLLDEVDLAPLTGHMLFDAVQRKKPTACSLGGWGWREFKPFRLLGLTGWLRFSHWLKKRVFGLMVFLMPMLL